MTSVNEELMIDAILSQENAGEIVGKIVYKYAGLSVENARSLLSMVSGIADKVIERTTKEALANKDAAFWLMVQREMPKVTSGIYFASMIPVCKVMFPDGKCGDGMCEAKKKYWAMFLEQFRNKKVFSWERDKTWADNFGHTQYLKLVEKNMDDCGAE